ncbi:MAG: hydrogenase [Desulfobulbaceae bacterium BRH_c16a]|nr:MAG: hydrogenase [Desulfobulbaceae bacterium BRH_c16a]
MLKIIKNRVEQGCKTTSYPKEPIHLYKRFRGLPRINADCDPAVIRQCAAICPQDAIYCAEKKIDLGKCTFCGRCENVADGAFVTFSQEFGMGASTREALVSDGSLPALAEHSKQHFKKLFGRSLQLRQISAAGCNSCEADTNVLNTPFFDLARFGIDFVASPRHADGIHVTGPISKNMKAALIATFDAVPSPKVVIASGACAISGGAFYGSPEIVGDLNSIVPVDLYIPGCPPHPLTTLHALLHYFK